MRSQTLRRALMVYLALLIPIAWLAMKYGPYAIDGDGMAYMDIADLMRAHHWAGVINGVLEPAVSGRAGAGAARLSHDAHE